MLSKHVIGIDFGASFTKIAYRKGFTAGRIRHFEERQSELVLIDGEELIPTLAIETGQARRPWVFGKQAAQVKPGPGTTVHRNWKSSLLRPEGEPPDEKTMEVAYSFFGWLLRELQNGSRLPFDVVDAAVMICVPAFTNSGATLTQLASVMEEAGWTNDFIHKTSEPKANTIGFCTRGRNIRTTFNTPNWGDMFSMEHPFIQYTRNPRGEGSATLAVLDIGSFTSDLSLIDWHPGADADYLTEGSQSSFRHGIVEQLDAKCLPQILDDIGETIDSLGFSDLENLKERLYRGDRFEQHGYEIGGEEHQELIQETINEFCDQLWTQIQPALRRRPVRWYLLTGGGSNIPALRERLSGHLNRIGDRGRSPVFLSPGTASRGDTALGATSLILMTPTTDAAAPTRQRSALVEPLPPLRNCPCGGGKHCMRCGGTGILTERPTHRARPPAHAFGGPDSDSPEEVVLPVDLEPEEVTAPDGQEEIETEVSRMTADDFVDFTLEGWMGSLVFGTIPRSGKHTYAEFRKTLRSQDENVRNRSWYRLLCLACALGARVPRTTIQQFWETTLGQTGFWEITTGTNQDSSKLDGFFEGLIHREFRSVYAEGEQAELLRRVFYDFRKLHYLTYENDFASVLLEILDAMDDGANPVLFLRSGTLRDNGRWRGVIGQSMTSPLLFLMREWRRMGLITSKRLDHHCYYMNTAARRGACRRGWLEWKQLYAYSLPDILEASKIVHKKLLETEAWDLDLFDIPLQISGSSRGRRRS